MNEFHILLRALGELQRQFGVCGAGGREEVENKSFRVGQIQVHISASPFTGFTEPQLQFLQIKLDNTHKECRIVTDTEE
jgi:hypothetical protein